MTVVLATTWRPRGELQRIRQIYPKLQAEYSGLVITIPQFAEGFEQEELTSLGFANEAEISVQVCQDWSRRR